MDLLQSVQNLSPAQSHQFVPPLTMLKIGTLMVLTILWKTIFSGFCVGFFSFCFQRPKGHLYSYVSFGRFIGFLQKKSAFFGLGL